MENKRLSSLAEGISKNQEMVTMKHSFWWWIRKEEERTKFKNRLREVVEREGNLLKCDRKK